MAAKEWLIRTPWFRQWNRDTVHGLPSETEAMAATAAAR
jgi:hypothetical protein